MSADEHYKIPRGGTTAALANTCSNMIADGWMPTGGMLLYQGIWFQAMWRPPVPEIVKIKMAEANNMEPVTK